MFLFAIATAVVAPAVARAAQDDPALNAPPTGLQPTTATLSAILAAHDKANAQANAAKTAGIVERWEFTDSGITGTELLKRSGTNYRSQITEGPFVDLFGQYHDSRWHQDANGYTSETTQIDTRSFYAVRVLEDAADPKNDVSVLGETIGARPAWVLQIKRTGYRHPEWVFYDKQTAQVVRVEFVSSRHRVTEIYDDFRTTDGVTQAWHMHDTDGRPELDDDWTLKSVERNVSLNDADFQGPPHRPSISHVSAETDIPAQTTFAGFVVRLNVNGRGLDFLLDSASSTSVIDRNVAHDLGLPTYGQTTHLSDGKPVEYRTTIADTDVGSIHLHNYVLDAVDYAYNPREEMRVVGVLGYDFFAANVLRFDFVNGRLAALPAAAFTQATPVPGGLEIPLSIDDGLPLVPMYIGDTLSTNVVLDTILPYSLVSGSFAAAHPEQVVDLHPGEHGHSVVPFADDNTFGVLAEVWAAKVPHLRFALSDYINKFVFTGNFPFKMHGRDVDGFVGLDYLHLYDVYFAYPEGRLIVKPNARLHQLQNP